MDVGGNNVDDVADRGHVTSLEGREHIGGGVGASVAGRAEFLLGVDNEVGELLNGAVAVEESLVTDDAKVDKVPLLPLLESRDLLGNGGVAVVATGAADEETNDQTEAILLSGSSNVGEGVAVGGVNAESLEVLAGDDLDIGINLAVGLAVTIGAEGGVGHGPVLALSAELATTHAALALGRSAGRRGGNSLGLLRGRGRSGSGLRGSLGLGGDSLRSGGRDLGGGEWAVDHNVGLGDGGDNGRSGVGTRAVGGHDRHNNGGDAWDNGGDGGNGVGAGRGADKGGGLDDAGDNAVLNLGGGVGADNLGGGLDDGGDTAEGVGAAGDLGGGGGADGGSLSHHNGRRREGVGARGRANLRDGCGNDRGLGCGGGWDNNWLGFGCGGDDRDGNRSLSGLGRGLDPGLLAVDGAVDGGAGRDADLGVVE